MQLLLDRNKKMYTCSLHLTRSRGVTIVWVIPHERTPPNPHNAKYFELPNSHEYCSAGAIFSKFFTPSRRAVTGLNKMELKAAGLKFGNLANKKMRKHFQSCTTILYFLKYFGHISMYLSIFIYIYLYLSI